MLLLRGLAEARILSRLPRSLGALVPVLDVLCREAPLEPWHHSASLWGSLVPCHCPSVCEAQGSAEVSPPVVHPFYLAASPETPQRASPGSTGPVLGREAAGQ